VLSWNGTVSAAPTDGGGLTVTINLQATMPSGSQV
jgi:hypothetical protein